MLTRKLGLLPWIGTFGVLAALLAGCGGNSSLGPGANTTSRVRVFNALGGCPGTGAVTVLQSNNSVALNPANGVAYGTASGYQLVRSGNGINTNVYTAGTTTPPLAPQVSVDLAPHDTNSNNGTYTVAVSGVCGQTTGAPAAPQIKRYIDNPGTPATNQALLRVVNLSPDAGSVVLYNTSGNPPVPIAVAGFPTNGVGYLGNTDYVAVTPIAGQSFNFSLISAGQALPLPANAGVANLQAGNAYTLFVFGEVNPTGGGQPLNIVLVQDAPITNPP
jgi:hypothetical protein